MGWILVGIRSRADSGIPIGGSSSDGLGIPDGEGSCRGIPSDGFESGFSMGTENRWFVRESL